jgi:hypothetical protein
VDVILLREKHVRNNGDTCGVRGRGEEGWGEVLFKTLIRSKTSQERRLTLLHLAVCHDQWRRKADDAILRERQAVYIWNQKLLFLKDWELTCVGLARSPFAAILMHRSQAET